MKKKNIALCAVLAAASYASATTATFDSKDTGVNHYYTPSTPGNYDWSDSGMTFNMNVTDYSWNGFTYSDVDDTVTSGYGNQYAVYGDGRDLSDTGVYAIGYMDSFNAVNPTVSFAAATTVYGFYVNNTTYAALDMLNGSAFSRQFTTNDWFKLTIEGFDGGSASLGTVDFYLADFTGYTDGADREDYLVTDWAYVNLTGLGSNVRSLEFTMTSSDSGMFGMNTPAYFAADRFEAVPEPAGAALLILGSITIVNYRRLRRRNCDDPC